MTAARAANAHGTNPRMAAIRLAGDVVYITATPEISVFAQYDTNKDGRISRQELSKQRAEMILHFAKMLTFSNSKILTEKYLLQDMSLPHSHRNRTKHLRVTLRFKLSEAPKWLDVEWVGNRFHPLSIRAQRMTAGRLAKQRPLGPVLTTTLDTQHPKVRLFEEKITQKESSQ